MIVFLIISLNRPYIDIKILQVSSQAGEDLCHTPRGGRDQRRRAEKSSGAWSDGRSEHAERQSICSIDKLDYDPHFRFYLIFLLEGRLKIGLTD
jgi:hypothetical protein